MITRDLDDTARLILMEHPDCNIGVFVAELREVMPAPVELVDLQSIWARYRGWNGRTAPTHSVETGRRRAS